jgi:glyceraldehyde 3-phosphate dehydrogenase
LEGDSQLRYKKVNINYSCKSKINEVHGFKGLDIIIDSSGVKSNVLLAQKLITKSEVKKIIITHSPDEVDFTMVLGGNELNYNSEMHHLISSSICDATAIVPVLKLINDKYGIETGYITTLHPWLNYQKLLDGPSSSWSVPGSIYHHYALGRSSIGNMIPKPTSALDATFKILPELEKKIGSFSYRTPTSIIGSADITLNLKSNLDSKDLIIDDFKRFESNQKLKIIKNSFDPLVSLDYLKSDYSVHIDHRWTEIVSSRLLKLVLWYDNEWGYTSKVIDQAKFISKNL